MLERGHLVAALWSSLYLMLSYSLRAPILIDSNLFLFFFLRIKYKEEINGLIFPGEYPFTQEVVLFGQQGQAVLSRG